LSLDDDDPLWNRHSGGSMHYGTEWGPGDLARAEVFYAQLGGNTKLIFDLLMDRPGDRIDADRIAAHIARHRPGAGRIPDRRTVATSLSPIRRPYEASGRRLPFDWWKGSSGEASLYGVKPAVARLFVEARRKAARS